MYKIVPEKRTKFKIHYKFHLKYVHLILQKIT